jgi:hypothetical protein
MKPDERNPDEGNGLDPAGAEQGEASERVGASRLQRRKIYHQGKRVSGDDQHDFGPCLHRRYSPLSDSIGSTRDARRAGR